VGVFLYILLLTVLQFSSAVCVLWYGVFTCNIINCMQLNFSQMICKKFIHFVPTVIIQLLNHCLVFFDLSLNISSTLPRFGADILNFLQV